MKKLKILPLKDIEEPKRKKNKINPLLPQPPFLVNLLAPVRSGKTVCISNLILNKQMGYGKYFDEIWYFSPTILLDKSGWAIRDYADKFNINIVSDIEALEGLDGILNMIIEEQKVTNNEKDVLLVLDDCLDFMRNSKSFNVLCTRFRHFSLGIIVVSQHLKKIPICARTNGQYWLVWKLFNEQEKKKFIEEIGSNFEGFDRYYKEATKEKYNFLYINMKDMTLFRNFEKEI